jgi:cell division protein FtsI/penicillin-binding protein 2
MRHTPFARFIILLLSVFLISGLCFGLTPKKRNKKKSNPMVAKPITKPPNAARELRKRKRPRHANSFVPVGGRVGSGPWKEPTFADSTIGDKIDGEDLVVRRAAVDALGPYNGTVVVADPSTGRILAMVNQKLALKSGFQPCSTIKIVAALAGLSEGIIDRNTAMRLYGRTSMNLTNALAHSNNNYFANVGIKLGFEKVSYYARLFGLGEKAGLNIEGEQPGLLPAAPPKNGGMGMMTSFGEGIELTPLQLAGLVSAVANGGTLYYLQHPTDLKEVEQFVPRVKRHLAIQESIPEVKPGMMGAVEYGTARRASYDPNEPIFGKTGTCTDSATPTHLGWFGSFNDVDKKQLTVVVLLTGGRPVNGPVAAGVAGNVYRNLSQQKYFPQQRLISPVAMISGGL